MKWFILAVVVFSTIVGTWLLQDRNGRVYKKVAKVVRPILSQPVVERKILPPFKGDSSQILEGTEAWERFNFDGVSASIENNELVLRSRAESVWWKNWRGPALFNGIDGDFEATLRVVAKKQSAPNDDVDSGFQFGGLMLRDPLGNSSLTSESYIFNVIGHRGELGVQVETKSTKDGWSKVSGFDWQITGADLKIVRQGPTFTLSAKKLDSSLWRELVVYERPDLPDELQIGIIAYAYSKWSGYHDLLVSFSDLEIRRI